jgi:hypothetical protein
MEEPVPVFGIMLLINMPVQENDLIFTKDQTTL